MPATTRRQSLRLKAKDLATKDHGNDDGNVDGDVGVDLEELVAKSCEFMMSKARSKTPPQQSEDFIPMKDEEDTGEKIPLAYTAQK